VQTNITVTEVSQARPRRGAGVPSRCASHKSAILALLRERGEQGILGSELYDAPHLYGRSPRNRISELRHDGHLIEGRPHGSSDWFYQLIRDNTGAKPERKKSSGDWYQDVTGHERPSGVQTSGPLFAQAQNR
jgi:hypothetical protein